MISKFLRVAAIVALLQFMGHTLLLLSYTPKHGPEEVAVVEAMKSHSFVFQGFTRSYWDFYLGYGLFAAINSLIEAVLFWQLALLVAKKAASQVGVIVGLFIFANLCYLILSWTYFFITPMIFDIAIAVCLVAALISTRSKASLTTGCP
jgi:hypothetical protein